MHRGSDFNRRDLTAPAPWSRPSPLPSPHRTARLVLRFWTAEDAPAMLEALDVDRASFAPWLAVFLTDNRNLAECIYQIERFRREAERALPAPDDFKIGIFDRSTGRVIGGTGIHRINLAAHEGEVGYWIRADRRRQGLCAEALAGMLTWSFTPQAQGGWGLRRIHIRCAGSNISSQAVPRKLGLREEARLVKERWTDGIGWDDTLVWGVCREGWNTQGSRVKTAGA